MMYVLSRRAADIRQMVCVGLCMMAAQMAMAQKISQAEILLFQTNHLQNIHAPVALTYTYKKMSSIEAGFVDEVHVDVTKINSDGSASAVMRFLSGSKKIEIPEVGNLQGNPALFGFLEHDIAEMKRLTGGSENYFRKRIRLALVDAVLVPHGIFIYQGKKLEGQEISIQPYLNDPLHDRFEKYVNKRYVFIISNQVFGGLYQIRTSSSGSDNSATPKEKMLMEETLTLTKEEHMKL